LPLQVFTDRISLLLVNQRWRQRRIKKCNNWKSDI